MLMLMLPIAVAAAAAAGAASGLLQQVLQQRVATATGVLSSILQPTSAPTQLNVINRVDARPCRRPLCLTVHLPACLLPACLPVCPFISPRSDYKEGERKKLAGLIHAAASSQNSRRFSPKMSVLDLQVGTCAACVLTAPKASPLLGHVCAAVAVVPSTCSSSSSRTLGCYCGSLVSKA
jgi:hypothetical protein